MFHPGIHSSCYADISKPFFKYAHIKSSHVKQTVFTSNLLGLGHPWDFFLSAVPAWSCRRPRLNPTCKPTAARVRQQRRPIDDIYSLSITNWKDRGDGCFSTAAPFDAYLNLLKDELSKQRSGGGGALVSSERPISFIRAGERQRTAWHSPTGADSIWAFSSLFIWSSPSSTHQISERLSQLPLCSH